MILRVKAKRFICVNKQVNISPGALAVLMPSFLPLEGNLRKILISVDECVFNDFSFLPRSVCFFSRFASPHHHLASKVTIFLCSGWLIILLTIFPIYLMLMISDDRHVMAVCWFRRFDMRVELERSFDKDYYWFEVQILLTTLLTIFLPISLIVACNIRVLTIGKSTCFSFYCAWDEGSRDREVKIAVTKKIRKKIKS